MAFYRRRPRPDAEKCADPAKARASALETLAGQEVSANMLYERLCRRYTEQAAAAAVAVRGHHNYRPPQLAPHGLQESDKPLLGLHREAVAPPAAGAPEFPPLEIPDILPEAPGRIVEICR